LEIRDDGKVSGLEEAAKRASLGPMCERERAQLADCEFRVEYHSGSGVTVTVRNPLERDRKRGARL